MGSTSLPIALLSVSLLLSSCGSTSGYGPSNPTPLYITASSLLSATTQSSYSATLAASGGKTPYNWSVSTGSLPAGLSLNGSTGQISGIPSAAGTFNFTAKVMDSSTPTAQSATMPLSIVVGAAPSAVSITTTTLPNGQQGAAYSATLAASGGEAPYTWSISGGALPSGLSLNASTGQISGTTSASGTFNFTAKVTDSSTPTTQIASAPFSFIISATTAANCPQGTGYVAAGDGCESAQSSGSVQHADFFRGHVTIAPPCITSTATNSCAQLTAGSGATVYVTLTYVNANGETTPSAEISAPGSGAIVSCPVPASFSSGCRDSGNFGNALDPATGYNVYAGTTSGAETKQNSTPIPIGSSYTITNVSTTGPTPPASNTASVLYPTRAPWNVAAVDYPVGYAGTLKDPFAPGNLPACVSNYNANTLIANADMQPCTLDHLDFSRHGGICFLVNGNNGDTVTFTNDKFASGTSNCTMFSGFIRINGPAANVAVSYSEFDDLYSCNCGAEITIDSTTTAVTVQYSAAIGVTGRLENVGNGASGSITNQYVYVEGISHGYEHGEVVEINSSGAYVYNELWNNYYARGTDCCNTALLYITSGAPGPTGQGTMTSSIDSYNVLIALPNPTQFNMVTVSAPVWIQAGSNNTIGTLTVDNNYMDASGSYQTIQDYPPTGTGSIGSSTCSGNKSLVDGSSIAGTLGSGASVVVCN